MRVCFLTSALFLATAGLAPAQTSPSVAGTAASPQPTSELSADIKIFGTAITALATLLGLPIVFLTYRKTRAEISKLELEAEALRKQQDSSMHASGQDDEGRFRIVVDHSPNTTVQVLADPRFLAPLLLLLDFIFAWVVLSLAGHLFSIFSAGEFGDVALAVLAAILLLPIARQVLRVRAVLRPPRTEEEVAASLRQARVSVYAIYCITLVASLGFGILLLSVARTTITDIGRYLAWLLVGVGVVMLILIPFGRKWFDGVLTRWHESDTKDFAKTDS